MNNNIIDSLSDQIIKPDFLNNLNFLIDTNFRISPKTYSLELLIKMTIDSNSDFNIFTLLKWLKYKFSKINNAIKIYDWDDDAEFDFQREYGNYKTYLIFETSNIIKFIDELNNNSLNCDKFIISIDRNEFNNIIKIISNNIENDEIINYFKKIFNGILEKYFNSIIRN